MPKADAIFINCLTFHRGLSSDTLQPRTTPALLAECRQPRIPCEVSSSSALGLALKERRVVVALGVHILVTGCHLRRSHSIGASLFKMKMTPAAPGTLSSSFTDRGKLLMFFDAAELIAKHPKQQIRKASIMRKHLL